jgi:hypothetical protein
MSMAENFLKENGLKCGSVTSMRYRNEGSFPRIETAFLPFYPKHFVKGSWCNFCLSLSEKLMVKVCSTRRSYD